MFFFPHSSMTFGKEAMKWGDRPIPDYSGLSAIFISIEVFNFQF
jgi:hypothetical protein